VLPGAPYAEHHAVIAIGSGEVLVGEQFSCLAEAQVLVEDYRQDYNANRPHSALAMKSPARFARAWRAQHEPLAD
jgi:putative transposase